MGTECDPVCTDVCSLSAKPDVAKGRVVRFMVVNLIEQKISFIKLGSPRR